MRETIEKLLEALGHTLYRWAYGVLAAVLILVGLGLTQVPKIEIRASVDEFLRKDDPVRVEYDAFLERFGRDDRVVIAVEADDVFDLAFLEKLRDLHDAFEDEVPFVLEVESLINARETRGEDDTLVVSEFLEEWPENEAALPSLKARALANPLYRNLILSDDATLTTVSIELETLEQIGESQDAFSGFEDAGDVEGAEAESEPSSGRIKSKAELEMEAVSAVNRIIEKFEGPNFKIYGGGAPILNSALMGSLIRDIVLFTGLSVLIITIFLGVVFRRFVGIIIPLSVAILSLLATISVMGAASIPLMPISEVVPSFLLSVGVGGSVHLVVIFQQQLRAGQNKEAAIASALGHSGLPIIMTSLTTAGGLASFAAAELMPVYIFGVVAPLGILLTLFLTLILSPALLAILPWKLDDEELGAEPSSIQMLTRCGDFATRNAGWVLFSCFGCFVIAVLGILRIQVSFNSLDWFADDFPAKVATTKIDSELGGAMGMELLIETDEDNGLHEPVVLERIDRARHTLRGLQVGDIVAGKSISLVDVVKEIHQALNGGDAAAYAIPSNRQLVSQELLLFENSGTDDLEDLVDTGFSVARFSIRLPMADGSLYPAFAEEVRRIFDKSLDGAANVRPTGLMVVMGRTFAATIETLFRSYGIALAVITPLMMILLGSFRLGLIAMIPNLFPIVLTLGLMGWAGIPLEMFSLLIGSVALGLAVDDTIHFMHGFRRGYARTGDVELSVRETLQTTGQALLFTSIILSLGFFIYVFSDLSNLSNFGILTAFAIVMAFLADVLLAPALMTVTAKFSSIRRENI
ncbi:MAG: RND family transporter [Myxococcota bacterium]